MIKLYTDYPILALGDEGGKYAPIREIHILDYDDNKYVTIFVDGVVDNIKLGYIYKEPKRLGETPSLTQEELEKILANKYKYKDSNSIVIDEIELDYSSAAQCYWCDIGEHQIQIETKDSGIHWEATLHFSGTPYEAHDPYTAGKMLIEAIKSLHKLTTK